MEACDAALKAANVTMTGWEKSRRWFVTRILPGTLPLSKPTDAGGRSRAVGSVVAVP